MTACDPFGYEAVESLIVHKQAELDDLIGRLNRAKNMTVRFGRHADWPDLTILHWQRTYNDTRTPYSYAAIKVGMFWFLTGKWQTGMTFGQLVDRHLALADNVYVVTEMEEL